MEDEGTTAVVPGIKLFGQTITLPQQPSRSAFKKEENEDEEESFNGRSTGRSTSSDTTTAEEHKRPDKIIPCPRCRSMDTKFCYFNNYNVNQPRHFCKGCQRYWTAGGALRNVPIGAGRRKLKPVLPVAASGSDAGQVFVGGFDFDKAVLEEYYWANHQQQQRRVMAAAARSTGYCEDFLNAKRRKNESSTTDLSKSPIVERLNVSST